MTSKVGKTLEWMVKALQNDGNNYMAYGSGPVHVPQGRLNEIPKVIQEHHAQEAERARLAAYLR